MCVQPMMLMMDVIQWYEKCDGADDGYGVGMVTVMVHTMVICVQPMMCMMDVVQWYRKCDGADDGYISD